MTLENTINDVLPDLEFKLDETWDDLVTLHHLISHQGGFFDWTPWGDLPEDEMLQGIADSYAEKYYLMNPPGAFYNYSNTNFAFAGLITESLDTRFWPEIIPTEKQIHNFVMRSKLKLIL